MKKLYELVVGLMILLQGVSIFAQSPNDEASNQSGIFTTEEKNSESPKSQEASIIFEKYKYLNPDALEKDLEKNPDIIKLYQQEVDRLIEIDDLPGAKSATRDKINATKAIEFHEKKKCNTHTWHIVSTAAASAGSMAVAIALFYLFQKPMGNNQELIATLRLLIPQQPASQNGHE